MIIKKENGKFVLRTEPQDGFKRADAKLLQLLNKLVRKFHGKVESIIDPDISYGNMYRPILVIQGDIKNDIVVSVRSFGLQCSIDENEQK